MEKTALEFDESTHIPSALKECLNPAYTETGEIAQPYRCQVTDAICQWTFGNIYYFALHLEKYHHQKIQIAYRNAENFCESFESFAEFVLKYGNEKQQEECRSNLRYVNDHKTMIDMTTKRKTTAADRARAYAVKTGQAGTGRTGGTRTRNVATGQEPVRAEQAEREKKEVLKLIKYVKDQLRGLPLAEKKKVLAGNELWDKCSKVLPGM